MYLELDQSAGVFSADYFPASIHSFQEMHRSQTFALAVHQHSLPLSVTFNITLQSENKQVHPCRLSSKVWGIKRII